MLLFVVFVVVIIAIVAIVAIVVVTLAFVVGRSLKRWAMKMFKHIHITRIVAVAVAVANISLTHTQGQQHQLTGPIVSLCCDVCAYVRRRTYASTYYT